MKEGGGLGFWVSQSTCVLLSPGAPSEDPHFPKVQWPPRELCSPCHNELRGTPVWDLGNTLRFFKIHFSPNNVVLDLPLASPGSRRAAQRVTASPQMELVTGNATVIPENAEIVVGRGTEPPGTFTLDVPVERLGAGGPQEADLGVTGAGSDQGPSEHLAELQRDKLEQPEGQRPLAKRDTGAVLLAEFSAEKDLPGGPSELRRVGRSSKQLANVPEREPEAGAMRSRGQWLQVLEGDFSHLDISLCVVLYSLSFMGLLAVYTCIRARMRTLKGHSSHPAA